MGLDFGLESFNKTIYKTFNNNQQAYYDFQQDCLTEDEPYNLVNYCGRGNIVYNWFRDGLNIPLNNNGVIMRPLTPDDIYSVMEQATLWYNDLDFKPVVMGTAFTEDEEENITLRRVAGIEVMDEDQAYHRFYCEDTDGRLFMTKNWIDPWDIYKYSNFIKDMLNVLQTMNWEHDVLLFYVSY